MPGGNGRKMKRPVKKKAKRKVPRGSGFMFGKVYPAGNNPSAVKKKKGKESEKSPY